MDDTQNNLPQGEEQKPEEKDLPQKPIEMEEAAASAEEPVKVEGENPPAESEEQAENPSAPEPETATETEAETTSEKVEADSEVVLSDEDLEKDDDTAEVQGDEDHEEEHPDELEMPDYAEYNAEDLVGAAFKLLRDHPIQKLKDHFAAIRKYLMNALNEERAEKLAEFVEQGGNEIDFEFIQPLREQFRTIYSEYRNRRRKFYEDLSAQLDQNLLVKKNLIERLKELVNKEESIGETFKDFRAIQEEWRSTGPVPRNESRDLWRTYHFHVENFYEYIKINKELRDLDYKKNKEHKEELVKKAQAILDGNDLREGFKQLQELHKEWRQIGPVEPELREELWQQFSGITRQIHEKRDEYFKELRNKREELLEEKRKLVEQLKNLPKKHTKHHEWQKAIKEVNDIQDAFKKIGRLNVADNDTVWEQFRDGLRDFNQAKNQFYKELKKEHHDNLEKKRSLLARAEELKDSENWRDTANELKRIQADWKKIGHVPKSESDKIWKEFRSACNHFFDRLTAHNKGRDEKFEANAEERQTFLDELEKWTPDLSDKKEAIKAIKAKIGEWRKMGPSPKKLRNELEGRFNKAIDGFFKAIDLDRQESQRIRFENKVDSLAAQGERELQRERDFLRRKLDEAKKELIQLENNLGFFSSSNPNSPIVKEATKNIDAQKANVSSLQAQLKMLGQKIKSMREEEEKSSEEAQGSED
tara:strand:- start:1610 stop:3718 length:2109 start_codon:yes stop_codon:yes gene_type:complete